MAREDYQEGYMSPEGNWYKSPEEEIKHHHRALEFAQEGSESYEKIWKWLGKPAFLYSGLRLAGLLAGIGPEIDVMDPTILDSIGGCLVLGGSICKLGSLFFGVRSAKRDLEKVAKRFGFNNSSVERIVTENSQ